MIRQMIKIDQELCNGCGLCASACHEGAIEIVDGKAALIRDDYCDGLGNCLPVCPTGAISFETREAAAYDQDAVNARQNAGRAVQGGCPGSRAMTLSEAPAQEIAAPAGRPASMLRQWPVQIKLVPVNAPYFHNANLLIAADCTAYACGSFHQDYMRGKVTLIGCPKLDEGDYTEKLTEILARNDIKSVTIVRMEVPCCAGIVYAAVNAMKSAGKMIPWQVVTLSTDGQVLEA